MGRIYNGRYEKNKGACDDFDMVPVAPLRALLPAMIGFISHSIESRSSSFEVISQRCSCVVHDPVFQDPGNTRLLTRLNAIFVLLYRVGDRGGYSHVDGYRSCTSISTESRITPRFSRES